MARSRVTARFKPDHAEFTRFATSDQMLKPLIEAANDVRALAAADARKDTGSYARGFKVNSSAGTLVIGRYKRAITAVVNEDPAAAPNEFGGRRNKAEHTLGKAGAKIGDFRGSLGDD
jgi:hypothetical protein